MVSPKRREPLAEATPAIGASPRRGKGIPGAAALGGMAAGAVSLLVAMGLSGSSGLGTWLPLQEVAAALFGVDALLGGWPILLTGLFLHLAMAALLGTLFGLLVRRETLAPRAALLGLTFGAVTWGVMTYLILPWANPTLLERAWLRPGWWLGCHLVFGLLLGWTPAIARRRR